MLPFTPILTIVGRFLHGFHFIIRSIMYSELSRIYSYEESQQKIPTILAGLSIGYCIGPLSNILFTRVDFWLGNLHFTYGNATSLPLIVLSIILLTLHSFFTHNVSLECKPNISASSQSETDDFLRGRTKERCGMFERVREMMCCEYMLLLFMSFHSGFGITLFPRIVPLVVQDLQYTDDVVNYCYLGFGLFGIVVSAVLAKVIKFSNSRVWLIF